MTSKYLFFFLLINILFSQDIFSCTNSKIPFYSDINPNKVKDQPRLQNDIYSRTNMDAFADSELFRVHYDLEGPHAVYITDNNNNGVPDYVDSCLIFAQISFDVQINEIGWSVPITDNGKGGSDHYDIYLKDVGTLDDIPSYGAMIPGELVYDNNELIGIETFIVIDNNFDAFDSAFVNGEKRRTYFTTSYQALKATVSHEFHHQVQENYLTNASSKMYEMTSVFMERRVFKDSRDFIQYVRALYRFPDVFSLASASALDGYVMGVFWDYIYERFNSDQVILRTWDLMRNGNMGEYLAINTALEEAGSDLNSEWCNFAEWCYIAGLDREGESFELRDEFPDLEFQFYEEFENNNSNFSRDMAPYTFANARIFIPEVQETTDDTLDILFANVNYEEALQGTERKSVIGFQVGNVGGEGTIIDLDKINKQALVFDVENVFCYDLKELFGVSSSVFNKVYPSPFKTSQHRAIYLPVPENSLLYDDVQVRLLNLSMQTIFTKELTVEFHEGRRMIIIENLTDGFEFKPGVYFFEVFNDEETYFYKFAVTN